MRLARRIAALATTAVLGGSLAAVVPTTSAQAVEPGADPFYTYSGAAPLSSYAPGAVLATRTKKFSIAGVSTQFDAVQILYRTTDQLGRPIANVTSLVKPLVVNPVTNGQLVSYQSFYDSLDPADSPSRGIAGAAPSTGGTIVTLESALISPLLSAGYPVNVPDTEGQDADFAAGPEYGRLTLDSIRAVSDPAVALLTGLGGTPKVAMLGYSGGAIATGWAAALAPSYAPDVDKRLVGATEGGVLVAPARNLRYVDGTKTWGPVAGMALVGVARAFDIDFSRYLSAYGAQVFADIADDSITEVQDKYPGLTFASLVKPEFAEPTSIPEFVSASNAINLGSAPSPTVPLQIRQGTAGESEGTPGDKPGIGPGDGVMIAGDVRTLARQYCAAGTAVDHAEVASSHTATAGPWLNAAIPFIAARFANVTAPVNTCSSIAPGNSLAPEVYRPGAGTSGTRGVTRVRVRLSERRQTAGRERTRVRFAVVTTSRASSGSAGRAIVRVDGRKVRAVRVPVRLSAGRRVTGPRVRLPRSLSVGKHRIRVVFRPDSTQAYAPSRSRKVTLRVVRPNAR